MTNWHLIDPMLHPTDLLHGHVYCCAGCARQIHRKKAYFTQPCWQIDDLRLPFFWAMPAFFHSPACYTLWLLRGGGR